MTSGCSPVLPTMCDFHKRPQRTALLVMAGRLTCRPILPPTPGRHQFPEQDPGVVQSTPISLAVVTRHRDASWVDLHQHDTMASWYDALFRQPLPRDSLIVLAGKLSSYPWVKLQLTFFQMDAFRFSWTNHVTTTDETRLLSILTAAGPSRPPWPQRTASQSPSTGREGPEWLPRFLELHDDQVDSASCHPLCSRGFRWTGNPALTATRLAAT